MAKNVATITISLSSFLTTTGGLYNVKDASSEREVKTVMVCPSCKNSLLDQVYCCQAGCKPSPATPSARPEGWTSKNIPDRVRVEGKGAGQKLILVSAEEIAEAKKPSIESGLLELAIYPAAQVEAVTSSGAVTYCFVPEKADKVYVMLLEAAADTSQALIGIINMRGNERLYRLEAREGTLRVVELLRPEDTTIFAPIALPVVTAAEQAMFGTLVATLSDDFDPAVYSSGRLAGLRDLLASKTGTPAPTPIGKASKPVAPTLDPLAAALAMATAAKAARKAA